MTRSRRTVLGELKALGNPANVAGMARYGINAKHAYGVSMPALRSMAQDIGTDHALAQQLWDSGIHEARILAALVADPAQVSEEQLEEWVAVIDSWDVCDTCCGNLFDKTQFAYAKAVAWSGRQEEFVKRAGFVLMAALAVHDKQAGDQTFIRFLPIIAREATDERNFVKKAVNWALRQIGKRNLRLNRLAVRTAQKIQTSDSRAARWVASDAVRELTAESTLRRLEEAAR